MGKFAGTFRVFTGFFSFFLGFLIFSSSVPASDYSDKYPANFYIQENISRLSNWVKPRYRYQIRNR